MNIEESREMLFKEYFALQTKFDKIMPLYEFGYAMIQISTKMLMDNAPRHMVALETVRVATEEGIKWHVMERAEQQKGSNHV